MSKYDTVPYSSYLHPLPGKPWKDIEDVGGEEEQPRPPPICEEETPTSQKKDILRGDPRTRARIQEIQEKIEQSRNSTP